MFWFEATSDSLRWRIKNIMREITLEELLAAGAHFGHQVIRANPKARDFVFEARDNIQIIDLSKTKQGLEEAAEFIKSIARTGGILLVVGTKRQAREIVAKHFEKVKDKNVLFVTNHWVGGILTNFSEVSKNIKKMHDLEAKLKDEAEKAKYTKKEIGLWEKERQRLEALYGGIASMTKMPDAIYIIDSHFEDLAVKEAGAMGVPSVAIVDTNADPNVIDYPIPANDDAVGSIDIITGYLIDAWNENFRKPEEKKEGEVAEGSPRPELPALKTEGIKPEDTRSLSEARQPSSAKKTKGKRSRSSVASRSGKPSAKEAKLAS